MLNTKKEELPELFEISLDISWIILVQKDFSLTSIIKDIKVIPAVYNKDGTRFKDLRTGKIYETGLSKQEHPKMAVMQRMCSMVENNQGDQDLMWDYMYSYNNIKQCEISKRRLMFCNGPNFCGYNFVNAPEILVEQSQLQDKPGCFVDKKDKITFNAVDEHLFSRQQLVEMADSFEKQYKSPKRQTKSKTDILNF